MGPAHSSFAVNPDAGAAADLAQRDATALPTSPRDALDKAFIRADAPLLIWLFR
jgi:hypothetical protein